MPGATYETTLDTALTIVIGKAQQDIPPAPTGTGGGTTQTQVTARPVTLNFGFGNGSEPIATDPILGTPTGVLPMKLAIPFPLTIVWARLYGLNSLGLPSFINEASVDVQVSQFGTFGAQFPLYGTGFMPQILEDTHIQLDLTGWQLNLTTEDSVIAHLNTFSGSAAEVVLEIRLAPTEVPIGVQQIVDSNGDVIVDSNGNPIVVRS